MSLINDMLRDLDTRRTRTSFSETVALEGLGLGRPLQTANRTRVSAMLAIIGMICITVLAWPIASGYNAHSDRIMLTAGSSLPLALPEISTRRKAAGNKSRQQRTTDNKPEATAPQTATGQQARAAPEMQPAISTPDATKPLPQESTRRQARTVGSTQSNDSKSDATLPTTASQAPDRRQPRTDKNALPADSQPEATVSIREQGASARHHEGAPPEPVGAPSTHVTRQTQTVEMQVAREYRAAVANVQAKQYAESVRKLQQVLVLDDGHHKARLLLAQLHIKLQEYARAEALLADGLARHPGSAPYAKQYAGLMIAQGRTETARLTLETALPEAGNDAEYQALLAGLYQQTGKAAEAAVQYRAALQLAPDRGDWWMGLGISEEQAGQPEAAREAYERSLRYPLKAILKDYVTSRIRNLPPAGIS